MSFAPHKPGATMGRAHAADALAGVIKTPLTHSIQSRRFERACRSLRSKVEPMVLIPTTRLHICPTPAHGRRRQMFSRIQLSKSVFRAPADRPAHPPLVGGCRRHRGPQTLEPINYTRIRRSVKAHVGLFSGFFAKSFQPPGPGRPIDPRLSGTSIEPLEPSGLEPPTSWLQTRRSPS